MAIDFEQRHRRRTALMRSIYDFTMGILWMGVGAFFLWHRRLGYDLGFDDKTLTGIFGIASLLYGVFRIYRGFKAIRIK